VKHPAIREPASGCSSLYSERSAIKPGISASANSISFLPRLLENVFYFESHKGIVVVLIYSIFVIVNFHAKLRNIFRNILMRNIYEMFKEVIF
jgi:hypothetical protein